jgi:hypothetical protein
MPEVQALHSNIPSFEKSTYSWALVAHACNPSYSGGRNQEDFGSKAAKKIHHKKRVVGWLKV